MDVKTDKPTPGGHDNESTSVGVVMQPTRSDAVFGDITEEGPNYRNVGWLGTAALMMKISIGLGVLSIPSGFHTLGIVPGSLCLMAVGLITTWCSYEVGVFKLRHAEVYGVDDAGFLMFGKVGRDVLAVGFCLAYTFTSGGGMLGLSIALNALSEHGACTAVFVAVIAIVSIGLSTIQTLGRIQGFAWAGVVSIVVAVFTVTIAVGVQDRPATAPKDIPWESDFKVFGNPTFVEAAATLSTFIFAYAATPALFPIVSEMRDPREYTKALVLCQSVMTATYITVGCVVYYYCGSYVASPALGSAGPLLKKISYGLAIPGLLASTVLSLHLAAKYIFVRILRGSDHLSANTFKHWVAWLGCTMGLGIVAYIIASAIPGFSSLAALVGALLLSTLTFQTTGCMWLYDNFKAGQQKPTSMWYLASGWAIFVVAIGLFLTIAGTYSAIIDVIDYYKDTGSGGAWACADNSNST